MGSEIEESLLRGCADGGAATGTVAQRGGRGEREEVGKSGGGCTPTLSTTLSLTLSLTLSVRLALNGVLVGLVGGLIGGVGLGGIGLRLVTIMGVVRGIVLILVTSLSWVAVFVRLRGLTRLTRPTSSIGVGVGVGGAHGGARDGGEEGGSVEVNTANAV